MLAQRKEILGWSRWRIGSRFSHSYSKGIVGFERKAVILSWSFDWELGGHKEWRGNSQETISFRLLDDCGGKVATKEVPKLSIGNPVLGVSKEFRTIPTFREHR